MREIALAYGQEPSRLRSVWFRRRCGFGGVGGHGHQNLAAAGVRDCIGTTDQTTGLLLSASTILGRTS